MLLPLSTLRLLRNDPFLDDCEFLKPYWINQTGNQLGDVVGENTSDNQLSVNVAQFKPDEIQVNINENQLIIEAKHEEKSDEFGQIQRHFIRKYTLPQGIRAENIKSELNSDGVLSIKYEELPKTTQIPITFVNSQ